MTTTIDPFALTSNWRRSLRSRVVERRVNDQIGRYLIGPVIAKGGMATIRLGQIRAPGGFHKFVAVKQLHDEFRCDSRQLSEEARLGSAICHPNVVSMIDVLERSDRLLLVMDYVHGESLAQLLRRLRGASSYVPLGIALRLIVDVLDGLHAVHTASDLDGVSLRIVHCDVSPHNVMVGADGIGRLLDFGVARAALGRGYLPGQIKGKFAYMAPEQLRGEVPHASADLFAVGVMLWEMLSGRRAFPNENVKRALVRGREATALPDIERELPLAILDIMRQATEHDPALRFSSARDFAAALEMAGPLARRAEVESWVSELAGTDMEQRRQLCAELDEATLRWTPPWPVARSRPAVARKTHQPRTFIFAVAGAAILAATGAAVLFNARSAEMQIAPEPERVKVASDAGERSSLRCCGGSAEKMPASTRDGVVGTPAPTAATLSSISPVQLESLPLEQKPAAHYVRPVIGSSARTGHRASSDRTAGTTTLSNLVR